MRVTVGGRLELEVDVGEVSACIGTIVAVNVGALEGSTTRVIVGIGG